MCDALLRWEDSNRFFVAYHLGFVDGFQVGKSKYMGGVVPCF